MSAYKIVRICLSAGGVCLFRSINTKQSHTIEICSEDKKVYVLVNLKNPDMRYVLENIRRYALTDISCVFVTNNDIRSAAT